MPACCAFAAAALLLLEPVHLCRSLAPPPPPHSPPPSPIPAGAASQKVFNAQEGGHQLKQEDEKTRADCIAEAGGDVELGMLLYRMHQTVKGGCCGAERAAAEAAAAVPACLPACCCYRSGRAHPCCLIPA